MEKIRLCIGQFSKLTDEKLLFARQLGVDDILLNTPVLPGQGEYFDPFMIEMGEEKECPGYATDIITDKCIDWLGRREGWF